MRTTQKGVALAEEVGLEAAALAIAVRTAGTGRRHTALTHRLQEAGNAVG